MSGSRSSAYSRLRSDATYQSASEDSDTSSMDQTLRYRDRGHREEWEVTEDEDQPKPYHRKPGACRRCFSIVTWPIFLLRYLFVIAFILWWVETANVGGSPMAPLCLVPSLANSSLCKINRILRPDFPSLMHMEEEAFDELLEGAAGGKGVFLNVKKVEMAAKDLAVLVRHSNLKERRALDHQLGQFAANAKVAGRGLVTFGAKVRGAVDTIAAVNDHALATIEEAEDVMPSTWSLMALIPGHSRGSIQTALKMTFGEAMNVLSTNVGRLILDGEERRASLEQLEIDLDTIHDTLTREDNRVSQSKEALRSGHLADLWIFLGAKKAEIRNYEEQLAVLRNVGTYQKQALAHVVSALKLLDDLIADLEELRERSATPALVGEAIPLSVHMKSIQAAVLHLREGRAKAMQVQEQVAKQILEPE